MNGGNGTMAPSQALANYLNTKECQANVIDIMTKANPLGEMLANMYNFLLRKSIFNAAMYMEYAHAFPIDHFPPFNILGGKRAEAVIKKEAMDAIVMICPWISRMVLYAVNNIFQKKSTQPLVFVNVVDLGEHMVSSWINNDTDYTFLPTKNALRYLSEHGLDENKADVLGVPLHADFSTGPIRLDERAEVRAKYNIKEHSKVVTVLGGREGVSNTEKILKELIKELHDEEFMVQCGINHRLYDKIKNLAEKTENSKYIHPLGFVDSMRELYSLSDVVITKPGAITVSELAVSNVDFILDTWPVVMPQEKGNVKFVKENNLGIIAHRINELPKAVNRILKDNVHKSTKKELKAVRGSLYGTEKIGDRIMSIVNEYKKG